MVDPRFQVRSVRVKGRHLDNGTPYLNDVTYHGEQNRTIKVPLLAPSGKGMESDISAGTGVHGGGVLDKGGACPVAS